MGKEEHELAPIVWSVRTWSMPHHEMWNTHMPKVQRTFTKSSKWKPSGGLEPAAIVSERLADITLVAYRYLTTSV
jgi:hypothetical protein